VVGKGGRAYDFFCQGRWPPGSTVRGSSTLKSNSPGESKLWYHYDRLGNVMAVTDANGNAYAVYTMEAFGNVLEKGTSTGYEDEHDPDPQLYHLTTKRYDPHAGLYYFNARWYDPTTGQFVSPSPARFVFEHPYAFCENSPTYFVDPEGLVAERNKPDCTCTDEQIKKLEEAIRKELERVGGILGQGPDALLGQGTAIATTGCYPRFIVFGSSAEITWKNPWPKGESCLNQCAREHEMVHVAQCRKMGWRDYNSTYKKEPWSMEKPAYEAQQKCLEGLLTRIGKR